MTEKFPAQMWILLAKIHWIISSMVVPDHDYEALNISVGLAKKKKKDLLQHYMSILLCRTN